MTIHPITFACSVFWACFLVKYTDLTESPLIAGLVGIAVAASYLMVHLTVGEVLGFKERWSAVEDGE